METPSAPHLRAEGRIGDEHVQRAEEVLRGELIGWVVMTCVLCLVWICWRNQEQHL